MKEGLYFFAGALFGIAVYFAILSWRGPTDGVRSPGSAPSDYVKAEAPAYNPKTPGQRTYDDLLAACELAGGYLWCHNDVPLCNITANTKMVTPP